MARAPITTDMVNRNTQACALHYLAWPGTLAEITEIVRINMKRDASDDPFIERHLRRPSTQLLLQNHWDVLLFRSSTGDWRLVSAALPATPAAARYRIEHKPPGQDQCHFCLIAEKGLGELVPLYDLYGAAIPAVRVHRACARAYKRLRALADLPDAPKPTKEDLLS